MISIFGIGELIPNLSIAFNFKVSQFEGNNQLLCKLFRYVFMETIPHLVFDLKIMFTICI